MRLFPTESLSRAPRTITWQPVLLLLLATYPLAAADTALTDYVPSDSKVVFGIRTRTIIDLLQAQNFGAEWRGAGSSLLAQTPLAGFDPLKDLDEVLIASTGEGENPTGLLVLRGRFDVERLASGATVYQGVPIVEDAKKSGAIAFLDASTAIAGDLSRIHAVLDQRAGGTGVTPEWAARVEPLRSRYSIWGIGDVPKRPPSTDGQPDPMDAVDRFEFGAELGHGLELTAQIHVRTPEDAEKMVASLGFLEALLKSPQSPAKGSKFEMHMDNGSLHVALAIPEEELNKAIREQRGALQTALVSRLPAEVASQLPHAAAPAPAVSPAVVRPAPRRAAPPVSKVVKDSQGDTMVLTLPGKR
ncbi:MAG: hypothetical protein LAQ69_07000 [Acidobacteriia bacterium]|nr:hypothetical protein [Terriglobia bacterium]